MKGFECIKTYSRKEAHMYCNGSKTTGDKTTDVLIGHFGVYDSSIVKRLENMMNMENHSPILISRESFLTAENFDLLMDFPFLTQSIREINFGEINDRVHINVYDGKIIIPISNNHNFIYFNRDLSNKPITYNSLSLQLDDLIEQKLFRRNGLGWNPKIDIITGSSNIVKYITNENLPGILEYLPLK
jgi:hypothetical protein